MRHHLRREGRKEKRIMNNEPTNHVSALDKLRRLVEARGQTGVGVHDGLSALLASKCPFDFLWVSSFCNSAAMGLPDAGILGAEEMLGMVRLVRRNSNLPIVVDMDAGYGDPLKIYHVVKEMVRSGASAVCIEDNPVSKRCSLYDGYERTLVTAEEHAARVRAAKAAVADIDGHCLIVARTEAFLACHSVEEALLRSTAYADAGADAAFVQSVDGTGQEILDFCRGWERRTPIFLAPTRIPHIPKTELFAAGASHVIHANQGLRAAHAAIDRVFRSLATLPSSGAIEGEISSVKQVSADVGANRIEKLERMFESPSEPSHAI